MKPKVRVWNSEYKQMVYANLDEYISFGQYTNEEKTNYECTASMPLCCYFSWPEVVVMLCTGLHDKSGRLIYEGDLIQNESGRIGEVKWKDNLAGFDTEAKNSAGNPKGMMPYNWKNKVHVIGNICEQ